MKHKTLVVSLLGFVFSVVVFFIFISCEIIPPTLEGTWVNSQYVEVDNIQHYPSKQIFSLYVDKSVWIAVFDHPDDPAPLHQEELTVTCELTDSEGNKYFKFWSYWLYSGYTLLNVHADNQTLEGNSNSVDYPTEINPDGSHYLIWYRPE
jgi:hypothetical protein